MIHKISILHDEYIYFRYFKYILTIQALHCLAT